MFEIYNDEVSVKIITIKIKVALNAPPPYLTN